MSNSCAQVFLWCGRIVQGRCFAMKPDALFLGTTYRCSSPLLFVNQPVRVSESCPCFVWDLSPKSMATWLQITTYVAFLTSLPDAQHGQSHGEPKSTLAQPRLERPTHVKQQSLEQHGAALLVREPHGALHQLRSAHFSMPSHRNMSRTDRLRRRISRNNKTFRD